MPLSGNLRWPIDYDSRFVGQAAIRTLFTESDSGAEPVPAAAYKADSFEDGRRWRVHLNTSLRWSDGEPLRAAHAAAAAEEMATRPFAAATRFLGEEPRGRIQVIDDATVEYHFARPTAFAPALLTLPQFAPTRPGGMSLGAYIPTLRDQDAIRLTRHPHAQDTGGEPEELIFRTYKTHSAALDAYASRELDVTPTIGFTQDQLHRFQEHPRLLNRDISLFGSLEFGHRAVGGLRSSAIVRRTLSSLLDRERLVGPCPGLLSPWRPRGGPAGGSVVRESVLRDALCGNQGNLEIGYADFAPNGDVVTGIVEQLKDSLGVSAVPRPMSFKEYVRTAARGDYDMLYTLTAADFPHPAALLTPWHSGNAAAVRAGLSDACLDGLIDEASACPDPQQQHDLWQRADERWLELMPRIPLVQVQANCAYSERVGGMHLSASGFIDFERLTAQ
ncbi:ABC transporter substrate-binding protein [Streptomyces mangrovi]|uniref:ABC transporter substrate-binding protein n=1 Tax=Streptomyces mangrovi TaxID=1206892 RepID=UPI00399C7502